MQKRLRIKRIEIVFIVLTLITLTYAVPMQINYQGYLTNENNVPVHETLKKITLKLYHQPENGNVLWTEIHQNVPVDNGIYAVILG
jgi:hypothetical protein